MNSVSKSDVDKVFGKILRNYRIQNDLTQEQLSEKLGISLKYISRIENGNNGVKTQTLIKYMNIFGINPIILYKDFIDNTSISQDIDLYAKIAHLSSNEKLFMASMADLLKILRKR